jgi:hypothetical protein
VIKRSVFNSGLDSALVWLSHAESRHSCSPHHGFGFALCTAATGQLRWTGGLPSQPAFGSIYWNVAYWNKSHLREAARYYLLPLSETQDGKRSFFDKHGLRDKLKASNAPLLSLTRLDRMEEHRRQNPQAALTLPGRFAGPRHPPLFIWRVPS